MGLSKIPVQLSVAVFAICSSYSNADSEIFLVWVHSSEYTFPKCTLFVAPGFNSSHTGYAARTITLIQGSADKNKIDLSDTRFRRNTTEPIMFNRQNVVFKSR